MPNIAQQDYLRLTVGDLENPTSEEKAEIRKYVQNGTIWDTIIEDGDGSFGRVIAVIPTTKQLAVYSGGSAEIVHVDYSA